MTRQHPGLYPFLSWGLAFAAVVMGGVALLRPLPPSPDRTIEAASVVYAVATNTPGAMVIVWATDTPYPWDRVTKTSGVSPYVYVSPTPRTCPTDPGFTCVWPTSTPTPHPTPSPMVPEYVPVCTTPAPGKPCTMPTEVPSANS